MDEGRQTGEVFGTEPCSAPDLHQGSLTAIVKASSADHQVPWRQPEQRREGKISRVLGQREERQQSAAKGSNTGEQLGSTR